MLRPAPYQLKAKDVRKRKKAVLAASRGGGRQSRPSPQSPQVIHTTPFPRTPFSAPIETPGVPDTAASTGSTEDQKLLQADKGCKNSQVVADSTW